jgi:hypothetical protein
MPRSPSINKTSIILIMLVIYEALSLPLPTCFSAMELFQKEEAKLRKISQHKAIHFLRFAFINNNKPEV